MAGIKLDAKATGPFFDYGGAPILEASRELVTDIIKEGEAKVDQQLYTRHGVRTGEYKRSIHQRRTASLFGYIEDDNSVKGKFLERGRYYKTTGHRFRGYRMFRLATQHLRRIVREVAGKKYARAVRRLT